MWPSDQNQNSNFEKVPGIAKNFVSKPNIKWFVDQKLLGSMLLRRYLCIFLCHNFFDVVFYLFRLSPDEVSRNQHGPMVVCNFSVDVVGKLVLFISVFS